MTTRVPNQTVSEFPPTAPAPQQGDLWWNTRTGQQFIYYVDPNTSQWVIANKGNGLAGDAGDDAFTRTTQDFAMPAVGVNVLTQVVDETFYNVGQIIYVPGGGYFSVYIVLPNQVGLINLGAPANVISGTVISSGTPLLIAGPVGPDMVLTQGTGIILTPNPIVAGGAVAVDHAVVAFRSDIPVTLPPSGPAGGALAGTYPNPTLVGGPLSNYAPIASPTFTGDPKAPTPATADNDTSIATTAFVKAQGYAIAANYLPLAGGTLTGDLVISHAGNTQIYVDSSDVGSGRPGYALTKRGTLEGIIQADGLTHGQIYYQSMAAGGVHQFFVNGVAVATMAAGLTSFPGGVSTVGNVTISGTVAGNARTVRFQTSGSDRWTIGPTFDAESGANAGSTFHIDRYSDAGAFLGTVMSIDRPGGNVFFSGAVNAGSDLGGYALWSNPTAGAAAAVHWNVSGFVANAQKWQGVDDGSKLRFQAISDAGVVQNEIVLSRDGTMDVVAPAAADNSTKVPSTAWVRANAPNLGAYCMAFGTGSAIPTAIALVPLAAATLNQGNFLVGSRFTPPAGVYRVECSMGVVSATAAVGLVLTIRKNGVDYARGFDTASGAGTVGGVTVSVLVSMNGTDFVEPFWSAGSAQTGDAISTYFNAQKVA